MSSSRAISLVLFILPAVLLAVGSTAAQNTNKPPPSSNPDDAANLPLCDVDHPDLTEVVGKCSSDISEYSRVVKLSVQQGWNSLISSDAWMKRACAVVDFTIRPDGGISTLKIPKSTGDLQLDRATLGGIISASPFPLLPAGCERGLTFRYRMYYNPGGRLALPHPSPADRTTAPDDEPVMHEKDIVPPVLIYSPNSEHPPMLSSASDTTPDSGRRGRVLVSAVVTSRGDVASAKILHGAGNGFDENAMALVVMSKFKPATITGIPVRTEVTLRVDLQ